MTTMTRKVYEESDWDIIQETFSKFDKEYEQEVDNLTEWVKKEPHLPSTLSRSDLGLFIGMCKGSTEKAKETIEAYFTHKTRYPELFTNRLDDTKRVEQTLDLVEIAVPEPWDHSLKGGRLSYVRLIDTDPDKLDFHLAMQVFTSAIDFELARVGLCIKGITFIFDMSGFHLGYLPKVTVNDVAAVLKYAQILENGVTAVHVINCNSLISHIMTLIRPFLTKALAAKLHFYTASQMEEFYNFIPRSLVPSTYGGDLPSMTEYNAIFRKRVRAAEEFIKYADSEQFRCKEDLRRVKSGCEVMNGSFRKLCID